MLLIRACVVHVRVKFVLSVILDMSLEKTDKPSTVSGSQRGSRRTPHLTKPQIPVLIFSSHFSLEPVLKESVVSLTLL